MPKKLKPRQQLILSVLAELGGIATTRQIAQRANLNANGTSQSLGALYEYVTEIGGHGGETRWRLKEANEKNNS
jgi:hypothetical protein